MALLVEPAVQNSNMNMVLIYIYNCDVFEIEVQENQLPIAQLLVIIVCHSVFLIVLKPTTN
jgi:hypothetical protein